MARSKRRGRGNLIRASKTKFGPGEVRKLKEQRSLLTKPAEKETGQISGYEFLAQWRVVMLYLNLPELVQMSQCCR